MARSRRLSKYQRAAQHTPKDLTSLANGGARREQRRGTEWFVRDVPAARATKLYRCPECAATIPIGQAHIVAWSAEYLFGDEAALRDRRHYHRHCW